MTPREQAIKVIARAIEQPNEGNWQVWTNEATAALDALLATLPTLGLTHPLPVEATEEMTTAAHHALYHWREQQGDPQKDPTNPQKHAIRYTAMCAVAPNPLAGDAP